MIEQGQVAPAFDLPDQDGKTVKLSDLKGKPVVVYFYPKADTLRCQLAPGVCPRSAGRK